MAVGRNTKQSLFAAALDSDNKPHIRESRLFRTFSRRKPTVSLRDRLLQTCTNYIFYYNPNYFTVAYQILPFMEIIKHCSEDSVLANTKKFIEGHLVNTLFYLDDTRQFVNYLISHANFKLWQDGRLNTSGLSEKSAWENTPHTLPYMKYKFFHLEGNADLELKYHTINMLIYGSLQSSSILSALSPELVCMIIDKIFTLKNWGDEKARKELVDRRFHFFRSMLEKKKNASKKSNDNKILLSR